MIGDESIVSASPAAPAQVRAVSVELPSAADLIGAIPSAERTLSFLRHGEGLVGWGEHARITTKGPEAAAEIAAWFDAVVADLAVTDEVKVPGSGPVAFVSLGFDDSDESVAIVPAVVLGLRGTVAFSTVIGNPGLLEPSPIQSPGRIRYADAGLSVTGFTSAVRSATARIRLSGTSGAPPLQKVVLAHDLEATAAFPVTRRRTRPAAPAGAT